MESTADKLDPIELELCLEEEKKKCLQNLKKYHQKYGCERIELLQKYLMDLCESLEDSDEIEEIKKQLKLLEDYAWFY